MIWLIDITKWLNGHTFGTDILWTNNIALLYHLKYKKIERNVIKILFLSRKCACWVSRDSYAWPWRGIDVMHNSSTHKEARWKIGRRKRHDDDGRRSDRSFAERVSAVCLPTANVNSETGDLELRCRICQSGIVRTCEEYEWRLLSNAGTSAASCYRERRLSVALKHSSRRSAYLKCIRMQSYITTICECRNKYVKIATHFYYLEMQ